MPKFSVYSSEGSTIVFCLALLLHLVFRFGFVCSFLCQILIQEEKLELQRQPCYFCFALAQKLKQKGKPGILIYKGSYALPLQSVPGCSRQSLEFSLSHIKQNIFFFPGTFHSVFLKYKHCTHAKTKPKRAREYT